MLLSVDHHAWVEELLMVSLHLGITMTGTGMLREVAMLTVLGSWLWVIIEEGGLANRLGMHRLGVHDFSQFDGFQLYEYVE